MSYFFRTKAIVAAAIIAVAGSAASAATVSFTSLNTTDLGAITPVDNPTASSITGDVLENVSGNQMDVFSNMIARSPWEGSANAAANFTAVLLDSSATYTFTENMNTLSFIWGSPDDYNDVIITLAGSGGTSTINGSEVFGTPGTLASLVTITGAVFNTVTFTSSSRNAFEFANITVSEVPLPAGGLLLLVGLGGLTVAARRRKEKV